MKSLNPYRKSLLFVLVLLCIGLMSAASPGRAVGQTSAQPPLIDRELFFGDPEISGAQISPDGKYIAFVKPFKGTRNIWVKKTEEPFAAAKPITADKSRPVTQYFWTRDGKY
ncbi:MAG: S9 family peptidase, partial [Pyrinomonadaceae bacterium]